MDLNLSSDIKSDIKKINKALIDSNIYREYLDALNNLSEKEIKSIREFKLKIKAPQQRNFYEKKSISNEYSDLLLNDKINIFLCCEQKLIKSIQDIYSGLLDGVNIELFS